MNKLLIVAVLVAVASACTAAKMKKYETYDKCDKCKVGGKLFTKVCPKCTGGNQKSDDCKAKLKKGKADCQAKVDCYKMVEANIKKAEDKARKAMEKKYAAYCPTDRAQCFDTQQFCRTWAAASPSQCTENPDWMLPNCANSCCPLCTGVNTLKSGTCPTEKRGDLCVKNTHSSCHAWAKKGECKKNAKWMKANCMQSCCDACKKDANKCPTVKETCKNSYKKPNKTKGNQACIDWAKAGECQANAKWMASNCSKECCPVCRAVQPQRAQPVVAQPRVVYQQPLGQVYQQPRVVPALGGYATGLPYQG